MAQRKKIRVLIVDDEKRFRTIAAATLAKHGLETITATGGEEATDHILRSDIDVVVLDAGMPGMHENETLRAIKALKPDVEVIMLAEHKADNPEVQASQEQMSADPTRPRDIDYLAEQIRDAFDQRKGSLKCY